MKPTIAEELMIETFGLEVEPAVTTIVNLEPVDEHELEEYCEHYWNLVTAAERAELAALVRAYAEGDEAKRQELLAMVLQ